MAITFLTNKDKEELVTNISQLSKEIGDLKESGGGGNGAPGTDGADGGYYIPSVEQISENVMRVSFAASDEDMPSVVDREITLPAGSDGLDGVSVTHSWDGTVLHVTSASGTSSADLKGKDGSPGVSGVHIGPDEPTDPRVNVWVNPDAKGVELEKEYELIQTMQVSESGLSEIIIDGVALESVRITILTGTCDSSGNSFLRMYTKNGHEPTLGKGYFVKGENISIRYELYKNGNIWDGYSTGGTWGGGGAELIGMNRQNELAPAVDDYITKIRFYTLNAGTTYPVGAVINIYGVKHNA